MSNAVRWPKKIRVFGLPWYLHSHTKAATPDDADIADYCNQITWEAPMFGEPGADEPRIELRVTHNRGFFYAQLGTEDIHGPLSDTLRELEARVRELGKLP